MTSTTERRSAPDRSVADQVIAVAEGRGRADVAESVRAARQLPETPHATVVVVGETKRGKSSFVNALLGQDVSPVDADVATNTYLVVRHSPEPYARVHRDGDAAEDVPLDSVAEWVTVAGNPGNEKGVLGVEVGLDHRLLSKGLVLIDTPGVGGLRAAHREVTLATLSRADALIFLLDPDAPLSRPEHAFLSEAAARISTVFFVLTKVDAYPAWEAILEEDRALLAEHAPELADAPFFPVSSHEKAEAEELGDEQLARESGFDAVEAALSERVVGRARLLRLANVARTIRFALEQLDAPEREAAAGGDGDAEAERALAAAQAREREFAERSETWSSTFSVEFQRRAANAVNVEFRRRLGGLRRAYEARIAASEIELDALPGELDAELRALMAELENRLAAGVEEVLAHLFEVLDLDGRAMDAPSLAGAGAHLALPALEPVAPNAGKPALIRGVTGASGVARAGIYARTLGLTLGPLGIVLALALGGAAWGTGRWMQHKARDEQEAKILLSRAVEMAQVEIDAELRNRLLDAQAIVQTVVRDRVRRRREELRDAVARQQARKEADAASRKRARETARRRLAETQPLRDWAERLYHRTRAAAAPGHE